MEDEKDMELQQQPQGDNGADTTNDKENPQYRGKVLMQRALEQLEKGNIEEFETDRALANKFFDEAAEGEEEMNALYNESRNFGIIYQVVESNALPLMETKAGRKSLCRIMKAIKGNKVLHEEFKAYNNFRPDHKVANVTEYINEAIAVSPKFSKKAVKAANEKLIRLIKSEGLNEMVDISEEKLNLFESIEYVVMNKKTLRNVDEFVSATNVIKEFIEKIPVSNGTSLEEYQNSINKLSESVAGQLTEDEARIIKEVYEGNGEQYFNEHKEATLSKIDELIESETNADSKKRLSQIRETVSAKTYSKDSAVVDIFEMAEIQETINE